MNLCQRFRLVAIGTTGWIFITAQGLAHLPLSAALGVVHAGIAGAVVGLAFVPRTMVRWA